MGAWALSAAFVLFVFLLPVVLAIGVLLVLAAAAAAAGPLAGRMGRTRRGATPATSDQEQSSNYQLSGRFHTVVVRESESGAERAASGWMHVVHRSRMRLSGGRVGGQMAGKAADLIRLLEAELDFIEGGGYGRPAKVGAQQPSMFDRTLVCIDHWFVPGQSAGCSADCVLMDFVPESYRKEQSPCHFIVLNAAGDTVKSIEATGDQERLEREVKNWLRAAIKRLKEDKDASGLPEVKY